MAGEARTGALSIARALCLQRRLGNRYGLAVAWDGLGYANHHLRRYPAATACYRRAIALYVEFQDRHAEGEALNRLGDTWHAAGDPAGARDAWGRSLLILAELRDPDAAAIGVKLDRLALGDSVRGSVVGHQHR